jgi:hypothetical protein
MSAFTQYNGQKHPTVLAKDKVEQVKMTKVGW